jgi:enediyne biosynthesis protein E4
MQVKYKEPLLLFHQGNDHRLHNVSPQAGPAFKKFLPARGLAIGDYDNDGAIDVIIGNNGGTPLLLNNRAAKRNNWLGIKLEGVHCNRDGIGAKLYWTAGGKQRFRLKSNGGSYLSSHDPREVLGLGSATKTDALEIHWPAPSKQIDKISSLPPNRYIRVIEGKGIVD